MARPNNPHPQKWFRTQGQSLGKGKARRIILEDIVYNYPNETSYWDVFDLMKGEPYRIMRTEHINSHLEKLVTEGFITSEKVGDVTYYYPIDTYEKFLLIFEKLLPSPNKVDLIQTPFFAKYLTDETIIAGIKDWTQHCCKYLREGIKKSKTRYLYLEDADDYKSFVNYVNRYDYEIPLEDQHIQFILPFFRAVPIFSYTLLSKNKGVPLLLKWLNDLIGSYPDIYALMRVMQPIMNAISPELGQMMNAYDSIDTMEGVPETFGELIDKMNDTKKLEE
jgi:hypothetical protein